MSKRVQDGQLRSKSSRKNIPQSSKLHALNMQKGLALGYRKGVRGGSWIARRHESGTSYSFHPLGIADDSTDADGIRVLTFDQAQDAARAWHRRKAAEDAGDVLTGPYTVAQAMNDYLEDRLNEKGKDLASTRSVVNLHILPSLRKIELSKLTHTRVKSWRDALAKAAPHVRAKKGNVSSPRETDTENPQANRARRATANRIFTVLRAALNFAYRRSLITTRAAWDKIRPFPQVDAKKTRYLTMDECKRLIDACEDDFRRLVRAALYTGCRYSELTALRVNAFNAVSQTVHILESKSGKSRHIALTDEGIAFFQSIANGKAPHAFLFTHTEGRHRGEEWKLTQQTYWMREACILANIEPVACFHELRHTYASHLAMNKTPMPVISKLLGHADLRMTERYAHLGDSYVADMLRANLPSFGFESGPTLVSKAS